MQHAVDLRRFTAAREQIPGRSMDNKREKRIKEYYFEVFVRL